MAVAPVSYYPDAGGGVTDHGELDGLADDDHTQYHDDARGDARYYTQAQVDTALGDKADASHAHAINDVTNLQTSLDAKGGAIGSMTLASDFKPLTDSVGGYDESAAAERRFLGINIISGRNLACYENEFWGNALVLPLQETVTGSSTINHNTGGSEAGHPGVVSLDANAGHARIGLTSSNTILLGGGKWRWLGIVKTPAALSDGTTTYTIRAGMGDASGTGDSTDGVYFRYTHSVNSGKFELVSRSNGSETAVDTGVALATNTWYTLEFEVNAAGTSIQAYINGSAAGSPIAATIPTGAGRQTNPVHVSIDESAGSTTRSLAVDFVGVYFEPTTAR